MDAGKVQVHILYFTQAGAALADKLTRELAPEAEVTRTSGKGCCKEWTAEHFRKGNVLVYIGACGITVRAIAPHIGSKETDPAVIVIDEKGENVIPILAGHLGGANEWARKIAELTKGKAVLTTATDVNGIFAVDLFAKENQLLIGDLKKAEEYLGKAAGTKGNLDAALGTLYTQKGEYAAAKKAYGSKATNNAAVQQILNEDYAGASKTLAAVKEPNATTAYLKAIVGARTNDKAAVYANLKSAIAQDTALKARAAEDIEFAKFAEDAEFQAIVK